MKLQHEIEKQSNLELGVLVNHIMLKLSEEGYSVERTTFNKVSFELAGWGMVLTAKQTDKVNDGEFQILSHDGYNTVKFKYSVSLIYPVIAMIGFTIFSTLVNYYCLLLVAAIPCLVFLQWLITKGRCRVLLDKIVALQS